jgi:DNA polymerase-1
MRLCFDIETNGFLDTVTTMWVLVAIDIDTKDLKVFVVGDLSWQDYLNSADTIVGHNIIGYDLNVLEKLFGWTPKPSIKIHDTLLFSQSLNFRRFGMKGHSLEVWGEYLGNPKIEFDDWTQLSKEMIEYCIQDVRVNIQVYANLLTEYRAAIQKAPLLKYSLRNEHSAAKYMAKAERIGWRFDKVRAIELMWRMQEEIDAMTAVFEPLLGTKVVAVDKVNGEVEVKFPKWNKNGEYNYHLCNWFGIDPKNGLGMDCLVEGAYSRIEIVKRKLGSPEDVKHWLRSVGWIADDWNYKRNEETRKMEKTSEKISSTSLELLGPIGKQYDDYLTTNSRANILRGWLEVCDDDWRIHGGAIVFGTPTGRMTHKLVANIPKNRSAWGADIRSLFIADEGTVIIGCDSKGNQARGLCHHLANDDYTDLVLHGDVHQANADNVTRIGKEILDEYKGENEGCGREESKRFYYAFLFGAGGSKLALYVFNKRSDKGNKLKEEFMKATPGLFELNDTLVKVFGATKRDTGYGYIYALDGSKIYSDSAHKLLNYLLQRFESVTVKSAVHYMMLKLDAEGIWWQPLIIMHDEVQFLVKDDPVIIERATAIAVEAFTEAAKEFGVMITGGDAHHGLNWRDTH